MSILAHLITGASKDSKQYSLIKEEISPPIPPVKQSSCRTRTLLVFFTLSNIESLSIGKSVLKSNISAKIFFSLITFLARIYQSVITKLLEPGEIIGPPQDNE